VVVVVLVVCKGGRGAGIRKPRVQTENAERISLG